MLSGILRSERATDVNVATMRAFVQFRRAAGINADLATKLGQLEEKFDDLKQEYVQQSKVFLQAIQSLKRVEHSEWPSEKSLPSIPKEQVFDCAPQVNIPVIQRAVAKYYGLQVQDLKATKRIGKIALARQIGMYLSRERTRVGYREIGRDFGGKDHTTVLYACRKIREGIESNTSIALAVEAIQRLL